MRYFVRKMTHLAGMDTGWGNGYVLLDPLHRFYGVHYDEINNHVNVHGGLTYSTRVCPEMIDFWKLEQEDLGTWCVGFDTAHFRDSLQNWPEQLVIAETQKLFEQLKKLS